MDLLSSFPQNSVFSILSQRIVRGEPKNTVEAVAGQIADEILSDHEMPEEVVVRVAKPCVALDGNLKSTGVELRRLRDPP
mmetsp:Transcript_15634/g.63812  ORF Transcript_15634/g.63812 Transcript_15634/m.63812 type:complete len:80 (-) Transcript_15634:2983-3222(-)